LEATNPESISSNQFWEWIFVTFCVMAITTGKLAIIAFIMQIEDSTVQGARKWVLWVFVALNVISNIFILIPIIWVQCTPTAKIWNNELPGDCAGRTRNQHYGYFQGSMQHQSLAKDFPLTFQVSAQLLTFQWRSIPSSSSGISKCSVMSRSA
jgi:hypothetical protein